MVAMFFNEKESDYSFNVRCPICTKIQMFDKSHTINTLHGNFQSQAHLAHFMEMEKDMFYTWKCFTYNLFSLHPKLTE